MSLLLVTINSMLLRKYLTKTNILLRFENSNRPQNQGEKMKNRRGFIVFRLCNTITYLVLCVLFY
jgi:hypothetical protein